MTIWKRPISTVKLGRIQSGHGASAGQFIKWHTIKDQPASVLHDVRRIREHPLVSKNIPIYGYIYDVYSGNLVEAAEATKAGQPR